MISIYFLKRNFLNIFFCIVVVLALQKYGNRSWKPWTLSIFIELLARALFNYFYKKKIPGGCRWLSTLEKEEQKRRVRLFFFYILRGPFYEQVTRLFFNFFFLTVTSTKVKE